jgi:hypothetical protein
MKALKQQCQAMKPDGSRCHAAALPDSDFCFFHDPSNSLLPGPQKMGFLRQVESRALL